MEVDMFAPSITATLKPDSISLAWGFLWQPRGVTRAFWLILACSLSAACGGNARQLGAREDGAAGPSEVAADPPPVMGTRSPEGPPSNAPLSPPPAMSGVEPTFW